MIEFLKVKEKRKLIVRGVVVFSIAVLLLLPSFESKIDKDFRNLMAYAGGKEEADTSIVLIGIDEFDIEKLGGWPLKRNYYALLINKLSALKVKVIGLEVFLSEGLSFQSVYNDVLKNEIEKSGKVILGSVAAGLTLNGNTVYAEAIELPASFLTGNTVSGHLNFFDEPDFILPITVSADGVSEKAFSASIAAKAGSALIESANIKINFFNSWKNYKRFSLLEFFDLAEKQDHRLNMFKNKIVIIGVTDPLIAKSISVPFNKMLPGIGIHAMASDNIINKHYFNSSYIQTSKIIFALFIFGMVTLKLKNKFLLNALSLIILTVVSVALLRFAQIEAAYSFFLFPLVFLLFFETLFFIADKRALLTATLTESEILKKTLKAKEIKLEELRSELQNSSGEVSIKLKEKVDSLQKEIDNLKAGNEEETFVPKFDFEDVSCFEGMVFRSKKMRQIADLVKRFAPEDANVLILGESGSGKELVAKAIHNLSKRKNGKFIAVNCAALSETLLESELFGHVKGAFTNAMNNKTGRFEAADGGTIFLDEIGETDENFQSKLLRVIQTGNFERVGSSENIHSDVRIVAATNKDLSVLIKEKKFREDLYYRLNVIKIELPALRERKEDIEILADHFIKREDESGGISSAALNILKENEWKGNVRELESVIKRAAIFARSEKRTIIKINDLPEEIAKAAKTDLETLILNSLREKKFSRSSINETAKDLGNLSRTIISENFRGICFKELCKTNFDMKGTAKVIAGSSDVSAEEKVMAKIETYVSNIEADLKMIKSKEFPRVKEEFASKYKNLPQRYHQYLDALIKRFLSK